MARVWRSEPILAVYDRGTVAATAALTPPGKRPLLAQLAQLREEEWHKVGHAARMRYETFGEATQKFDMGRRHYYLNMIGARRSHHGKGLSRRLLDAVHAMSQNDPVLPGVTLITEDSCNVSLYEHFGYEIVGHIRIEAHLETWGFFRPNNRAVYEG